MSNYLTLYRLTDKFNDAIDTDFFEQNIKDKNLIFLNQYNSTLDLYTKKIGKEPSIFSTKHATNNFLLKNKELIECIVDDFFDDDLESVPLSRLTDFILPFAKENPNQFLSSLLLLDNFYDYDTGIFKKAINGYVLEPLCVSNIKIEHCNDICFNINQHSLFIDKKYQSFYEDDICYLKSLSDCSSDNLFLISFAYLD